MIYTVGRAVSSDTYVGIVIVFLIASIAMWIYEKSQGMGVLKITIYF